ncbi:MAG: hypothetical protein QM492_10060 [Rhodobacterales bacterium]
MTDKPGTITDQELAAFFNAAKQQTPMPSATLMEAVARDAQAEIPFQSVQPLRPRNAYGRAVLCAIGGWRPVFALASFAAVGVIIGYSTSAQLPFPRGSNVQTVDTFTEDSFAVASDIEILFQEG